MVAHHVFIASHLKDTKYYPQSTYLWSTTVSVPRPNWDLPDPFSRKRVCPPGTKGGTHWPAGDEV